MSVRPCARSVHFMVHHRLDAQMSTAPAASAPELVDDCAASATCRLGLVVPKRHAKRAATRNLIKRAVRERARGAIEVLPAGDWVVRLRAPFDRKHFVSAQSPALAEAVRVELGLLFADIQRHAARSVSAAPAAPAGHAAR